MEANLIKLSQTPIIKRRRNLRQAEKQGIDYINLSSGVTADEKILDLYFIKNSLPVDIKPANITIAFASQPDIPTDIKVILPVEYKDSYIKITINLSTHKKTNIVKNSLYILKFLGIADIDPKFSFATFSLVTKSALDPLPLEVVQSTPQSFVDIDYLTKDYKSFRRLMLDRLTILMPKWKGEKAADSGMAMIEIIAYVADYLSYYQDAVATEAYLGTARKRLSVKRHARLLDYFMHEGCNSRVWVHCSVDDDGILGKGTKLLTKVSGGPKSVCVQPNSAVYNEIMLKKPEVFETMHPAKFYKNLNKMDFYTWGGIEQYLPAKANRATLKGHHSRQLKAGDVLIFEEIKGKTSEDESCDKRHAVRLITVANDKDEVANIEITTIEWAKEDELPFDFDLSKTVARGNIVLADHGRTIAKEDMPKVEETCDFRPELTETDIACVTPYDHNKYKKLSAKNTIFHSPVSATPFVKLENTTTNEQWTAKYDLFDSDRFDKAFTVEMENDRRCFIRFGNGKSGKRPVSGMKFTANYRVGNGLAGNIGRDVIFHVVTTKDFRINAVRNPMSASNGCDPEDMEYVRFHAPAAFKGQMRCITLDDYIRKIKAHPEVQKAAGTMRWTGSWHTVVITITRKNNVFVTKSFCQVLSKFMKPFLISGAHLEIVPPVFVPIDISINVTIEDGIFQSTVEKKLTDTFSNVDISGTGRGYFHPDNLAFGRDLYASDIIAVTCKIPEVKDAVVSIFRRMGSSTDNQESIPIGPLEIIKVNNNINALENGMIRFILQGGL